MKCLLLLYLVISAHAHDAIPSLILPDPLDMIQDPTHQEQDFNVRRGISEAVLTLAANHMVGGTVTSVTDHPYVCGLMALDSDNEKRFCACVVITSNHVLTAAQCGSVVQPNQVAVHLGSNFSFGGGVKYYVSFITLHPDYDGRKGNGNDIAVIRLGDKLHFGTTIAPAKLPKQGSEVPDNTPVKQVGWGATSRSAMTSGDQLVLMEYEIFTMSQKMCSEVYDHVQDMTGLGNRMITHNMICAGKPGRALLYAEKSECQGDAGGPLVYKGVVVGISSLGLSCAGSNYPTIHTKVARYIEWINHVISVPQRHSLIHHDTKYRFGPRSKGSIAGKFTLTYLIAIGSAVLLIF